MIMPLTPILKKSGLGLMSPATRKRVLFTVNAPDRAHAMILKFRDTDDNNSFTVTFRGMAEESPKEQMVWLSEMTECVHLLDRRVDELVLEFLKIPWYNNSEVANCAENFLVTLATAHTYYTYHILHQLIQFLLPKFEMQDSERLKENPGRLTKKEGLFYQHVLCCIVSVFKHVPMSQSYILTLAKKCMPYFRQHVHTHAVYTQNLLLLASVLPQHRPGLLQILVNNMITIDVHAPRAELAALDDDDDDSDEEDVFDMEVEESTENQVKKKEEEEEEEAQAKTVTRMDHPSGNTLDVLMTVMLQYVHDTCHGRNVVKSAAEAMSSENNTFEDQKCRSGIVSSDGEDVNKAGGCECGGKHHDIEALKQLFVELRDVFSHIILSTHSSSHVQFLLFYILALRPGLTTIFLEFLRIKKFEIPNCSRDVRRNAMVYIGSLLARGKFVPFSHVHSCLEIICLWCNNYLDKQEDTRARNYEDLQLHAPFYYACQTIFYVFTFRYKEYTENAKKLDLARGLNLERLVQSQLNPLRVCAVPIVNNFAAVTRRFQLAYCYTIMENNKRLNIPAAQCNDLTVKSTLDVFFPFDPYLLVRSKKYIVGHYREFLGLPEDEVTVQRRAPLAENPDVAMSPCSFDFSYSTSPGYQKWPNGATSLGLSIPGLVL